MSLSGHLAALANMLAPDEILKNSLANFAFENFEIASYRALIEMARKGGFNEAVPLLEETLKEEIAMAAFIEETLPVVVERYMTRREAGEQAGH